MLAVDQGSLACAVCGGALVPVVLTVNGRALNALYIVRKILGFRVAKDRFR